jgi:hypothetical protein
MRKKSLPVEAFQQHQYEHPVIAWTAAEWKACPLCTVIAQRDMETKHADTNKALGDGFSVALRSAEEAPAPKAKECGCACYRLNCDCPCHAATRKE